MKLRRLPGVLAFVSASALAGAPYDGIWQIPQTSVYYTVNEKQDYVIISNYFTNTIAKPGEIVWNMANGQKFVPDRIDGWDLYFGPASAGVAKVEGQSNFGACKVTATFDFNKGTVRVDSVAQTERGKAQSIKCQDYMPPGASWEIEKVF